MPIPSFDDQVYGNSEEIFEINDFTVVTEHERFIVQLEAILHDWNVQGKRQTSVGKFDQKLKSSSKSVKFRDKEFNLTYYHFEDQTKKEEEEEESVENDDEEKLGYLSTAIKEINLQDFDLRSRNSVFTQYGIMEHILLEPIDHLVDRQDYWRDILSAFNVTLVNSGCEIPLFVRFGEPQQNIFNGTCMNRNASTVFETIDATEYIKKMNYFSGLVEMFKEKVGCESTDLPPVEASVQFDYVYKLDFENGSKTDDGLDSSQFHFEFDIGDSESAVNEICLSVLWPRLNEETVNETDNFSDLDPYTSPRWLVNFKLDGSRKILFNTMDELLDIKESPLSEKHIKHYAQHPSTKKGPEMAGALSMITRSHGTETTEIGFIPTNDGGGVSVNEGLIQFISSIMPQLFQDPFPRQDTSNFSEFQQKSLASLSRCKAAPINSLTSRISIALSKLLNNENGLSLMCTFWLEFVERLSEKWDNSEDIQGLDLNSTPDLSCCLLHQKLQMLQFCIETKRKRHAFLDVNPVQPLSSSSSSSDIFFDAEDENAPKPKSTELPKDSVPKGRLEPLDECLLSRPTERIYIPQTQDKGPMTDDMIEAITQHLAKQSSHDRIKEQLDVLLSDMQAFKAANPGAQIEDFIFWHSPRDWSKDEEGNVTLSERMLMPDNIWLDTWKNARPIPVTSQPRLFNEAKEAHTILQNFKDFSVRDLIDLIQPVAFYNAGYVLVEKVKEAETLVEEKLPELCKYIVKATQRGYSEDYFDTYRRIEFIENQIFWLQCVKEMLDKEVREGNLQEIIDPELFNDFALNIIKGGKDAVIRVLDAPNGALAMCIRQLMNNACKFETGRLDEDEDKVVKMEDDELRLPTPFRKHYIFRWLVPRPGLQSRKMPQRMYACVGERHFRVSGAFTDDSTFM